MAAFGSNDPREMPMHFFLGAVRIDYRSAVRSNVERQNFSMCPRHWYVDAVFRCIRCDREFDFSAEEQRVWFEEYRFWVDAFPKHCLDCRRALRGQRTLRQEYDRWVEEALSGTDLALKERIAQVIDLLYELGGDLPPRITENRRRLARDLARSGRDSD